MHNVFQDGSDDVKHNEEQTTTRLEAPQRLRLEARPQPSFGLT